MNEQQDIRQHIDAILASVETSHVGQRPTTTDEQKALYQQRPQTIINVYVIEREQDDDPRTVESTLDALIQESQNDEEPETPTTPPIETHRTCSSWRLIPLVMLCTLIIGAGSRYKA